MAGEPVLTVVGNLGGDPELRFLPSGVAVCNFSVGSTPRTKNRNTEEWEDGETLWLRCAAWREMGENVAESLGRGDRVIVRGRLKQRTYDTKEGETRTVFELDVDDVGPSLWRASAKVTKTGRTTDGGWDTNPRDPAPPRSQPAAPAPRGDDTGRAPQGWAQGRPKGRPQGRPQGGPQGGPPTHDGYGQAQPRGAQTSEGDPWATNPQGTLPAAPNGQAPAGEGWGQTDYGTPPF